MLTVCLRLTIVYTVVLASMHIMGKRQIGELDISELVTAIFVSELATAPVSDTNIPLLQGVLPTLLLLCFEIILSFLSVKSNFFKNLSGKNPTFLIQNGKLDIAAMKKVRITINELMSEARINGIPDISQIYHAILEPNGKISFCLKSRYQPSTPHDLNIETQEQGIQHLIISDGDINYSALKNSHKTKEWLKHQIKKSGLSLKQIFMVGVDDTGNIYIIKKETK